MSIFYVFQGHTYAQEKKGGYLWSPQLNKRGGKNVGFSMMKNVHQGDFILHNVNGKLLAISVAKNDCYEAKQPYELSIAEKPIDWNEKGWRVDVEYFELDAPLIITDYQDWFSENFIEGSAFTRTGKGKQQYMCSLAKEHAIFILEKAISLQKNQLVLKNLKEALSEITSQHKTC